MAATAFPARDIPMHFGRDSFAAVAARSVPVAKAQHPLPTPPNSISPSLPPHGLRAYETRSAAAHDALEHVDSDLDLHDGPDDSVHDGEIGQEDDIGSLGSDMAGRVTPGLLAKHHLPEILLAHGPLAIRHITGYLTTSVPGFASIPPAKARRLVVGALEGRGSGGEGGGVNGDVKFEKVGWGRWDAKQIGKASGRGRDAQQSPPPSMPSSYSAGMPIAKSNRFSFDRTRLNAPVSSWAGDSVVSRDDIDSMMLENEADKMSLDGDASCSSSEAPPEDDIMGDDPEDMTDDEDWAAVGAAALRAPSYSASGPNRNFLSSSGGPSLLLAKSVPFRTAPQHNNIDFSSLGMASDSQEREAVEALLRLGSV
jgi:hypothetical protein